jgi:hypothetical protein
MAHQYAALRPTEDPGSRSLFASWLQAVGSAPAQISKNSIQRADISQRSGKIAFGRDSHRWHPKHQRGDSMRTQKPSAELEDWAVVPSVKNGKYEELRPGNLLVGRAFGHQKIKSGTFIFTSPIMSVDLKNNVAETKNTSYRLGEASHEYKMWSKDRGGRTAA